MRKGELDQNRSLGFTPTGRTGVGRQCACQLLGQSRVLAPGMHLSFLFVHSNLLQSLLGLLGCDLGFPPNPLSHRTTYNSQADLTRSDYIKRPKCTQHLAWLGLAWLTSVTVEALAPTNSFVPIAFNVRLQSALQRKQCLVPESPLRD